MAIITDDKQPALSHVHTPARHACQGTGRELVCILQDLQLARVHCDFPAHTQVLEADGRIWTTLQEHLAVLDVVLRKGKARAEVQREANEVRR